MRFYQTSNNVPGCVVKQNGKYGVISFYGNWLVKPEHYKIQQAFLQDCFNFNDDMVGLEVQPDPILEEQQNRMVMADGSIYEWEPVGRCGDSARFSLYWDARYERPLLCEYMENEDHYVIYAYDEAAFKSSWDMNLELGSFQTGVADTVMVQSVQNWTETDDPEIYALGEPSKRYALFDTKAGTLLTDFFFEDYAACGFREGVLPVKQDGAWRYIDEKGEDLTGRTWLPSAIVEGEEQMYSASNGFVILRTEDGFGLMDVKGHIVIEPKYEDLTQVGPDGLLYVKDGGKWGVAYVLS